MFPKMALPHLTVAMLLVVICSSPNSTAILGKRTFEVMTSRPREPYVSLRLLVSRLRHLIGTQKCVKHTYRLPGGDKWRHACHPL